MQRHWWKRTFGNVTANIDNKNEAIILIKQKKHCFSNKGIIREIETPSIKACSVLEHDFRLSIATN